MNLGYAKIIFILCMANGSLSLYAQALKKVAILDFINIEKNNNFQYLETSITDAVTEMLKKRFAFMPAVKETQSEIAAANYLYREDYYTKSTAMNLGLLTKQDVVIAGGFKILKRNGKDFIITEVRILDMQGKKVISEFSVAGPADSSIFQSIEELAIRVAEESKSVLPNKDDWAKSGLKDESSQPVANQIGIVIGYSAVSIPNKFSGDYVPNKAILPKDYPTFNFALDYSRLNFPYSWLRFWAYTSVSLGSRQLESSKATNPFDTSLFAVSTIIGLSYSKNLNKTIGFRILGGGGYLLGSLSMKFNSFTYLPVDASGQEVKDSAYLLQAITSMLGARFVYHFSDAFDFELGPTYQHVFFGDSQSGQVRVEGGGSMKF